MKKVIFIAASLLAIAACNKAVFNVQNEVGYLNFNLAADDIIVTTKNPVSDVDGYTVYVGETPYNYGTDIKAKVLAINPGTYAVYAENITPDVAHTSNDGKGSLRLASASQEVQVAAGQTAGVELHCTAVNAKITVTFDDSFKAAFSSWNVVLGYNIDSETENRKFTITKETTQTEYFYNIRPDEKGLKLYLTAQPTVASQNQKENTTNLPIQAGYHYTVKYSAGTSGYVNITVTAEDSLKDGGTTTVPVNPYAPEQNS